MKRDTEWESELAETPLLRSLRDRPLFFQVPAQYFADWDEKIMSLTASEAEYAESERQNWPKGTPFQVPNDYFEQLPDLRFRESLPKGEVFQAPDGYFDTLQDQLAARLTEDQTSESTTIKRPLWRRMGLVGVAVAAAVLSIFLFRGVRSEHIAPQQWQDFSEDELLAQVDYMDTDLIVELVDEEALPSLGWGDDLTEEELDMLLEEMDPEELLDMAQEGIVSPE
ncbi:MAG: hypothetical protein AAF206_27835 [Bacteroidota bacterium]